MHITMPAKGAAKVAARKVGLRNACDLRRGGHGAHKDKEEARKGQAQDCCSSQKWNLCAEDEPKISPRVARCGRCTM